MQSKTCKKCNKNQDLAEFRQGFGRDKKKLYHRNICISCERATSSQWNKEHKPTTPKPKKRLTKSLRRKISKYIKEENLTLTIDEFIDKVEGKFESWMKWEDWNITWALQELIPVKFERKCKFCGSYKLRRHKLICDPCDRKMFRERCQTYLEAKDLVDSIVKDITANKKCPRCKQTKLLRENFRPKLINIENNRVYFSGECRSCEKEIDKFRDKEKVKVKGAKRHAAFKQRMKEDPEFREQQKIYRREYNKKRNQQKKNCPKTIIRKFVSRYIFNALKVKGGSKNGESVTKYLPYTIDELKIHIESQFEPWMNWSNRGRYEVDKWDDNDPTTWKWHIDHIIPHSLFTYTSMEDPEFLKCWDLKNLRPLNAKQNVLDGVRRIRHKKTGT